MAGKLSLLVVMVMIGVAASAYIPVAVFMDSSPSAIQDNYEPVQLLERIRRSSPYDDHKPKHSYHKGKGKGKVGPVYTFAKTDYNGNFKWGVRHRVGSQYADPQEYDYQYERQPSTNSFMVARPKRASKKSKKSLPTWIKSFAMTNKEGHFKWGVKHNIH